MYLHWIWSAHVHTIMPPRPITSCLPRIRIHSDARSSSKILSASVSTILWCTWRNFPSATSPFFLSPRGETYCGSCLSLMSASWSHWVHSRPILKIENIQAQSREMSMVHKFTSFNQHKSLRDKIYSPAFYTSPKGYKMCISMYANGNGDGVNTHVSVYVYLMKGENDECLPWLFTYRM